MSLGSNTEGITGGINLLITPLSRDDSIDERVNTVTFNGQRYSTLLDVPVDEPKGNSQAFFLPVPTGNIIFALFPFFFYFFFFSFLLQ
jgi:hypothetical protein